MPEKEARALAFWNFLGLDPSATIHPNISQQSIDNAASREGLYKSVTWGTPPQQVQTILLDTRWFRDAHCIPSAATLIPKLGAGLACVTRWLTSALWLNDHTHWWNPCQKHHEGASILGTSQWLWLEQQLHQSAADMIVLVSSVQVLTTNPVMESWCHFPADRRRLLNLLAHVHNSGKTVLIISGDVHHAEILDPTASFVSTAPRFSFLEVTSSGMTHTCAEPFYGFLCKPLLDFFHSHRFRDKIHDTRPTKNDQNQVPGPVDHPYYYIGYNYGTIAFDWEQRSYMAKIHNTSGHTVLSTGWYPLSTNSSRVSNKWTQNDVDRIVSCGSHSASAWNRLMMVGATLLSGVGGLVYCAYPRHFRKPL
jgi:alkaline phosphatase D